MYKVKKLNVWAKSLKCCLKTVRQLFLTMHVSYVVFSFGFVLFTLLSSLFTQYEIALSFIYFSILGMGEILRIRGYIHNILQYHIVIIMLFF